MKWGDFMINFKLFGLIQFVQYIFLYEDIEIYLDCSYSSDKLKVIEEGDMFKICI